jgi:hypothetical protein
MFSDFESWHTLRITLYGTPPVIPTGTKPFLRRRYCGIYQKDKGYRWRQRRKLIKKKKGGGEGEEERIFTMMKQKKELESTSSKELIAMVIIDA